MTMEVIEDKMKYLYNGIRTRLDKLKDKQLLKDRIKREEFVGILQGRYGYTREKAESEMSAHYSEILLG